MTKTEVKPTSEALAILISAATYG